MQSHVEVDWLGYLLYLRKKVAKGTKESKWRRKGKPILSRRTTFVCFAVRDISEVEKGRNSEKKIILGLKHSYSSGLAPQLPTSTQ